MSISIPATKLANQPNFKTPPFPSEFRGIRVDGYVNVFELGLGNRNLWGTETMLGDWHGKYLLVAKDFYPRAYIDLQKNGGEKWPYRHHPAVRTNTNLLKILNRDFNVVAAKADGNVDNLTCDFLYISACFLLRDDKQVSGKLPPGGLEASVPVVRWTIEKMPNLTTIVAMGKDAEMALGNRSICEIIRIRNLRLCRVPHPSRGSLCERNRAWSLVFDR